MQLPEWWNDPYARQIIMLIGLTGAVVFVLFVYVFAFYGWS